MTTIPSMTFTPAGDGGLIQFHTVLGNFFYFWDGRSLFYGTDPASKHGVLIGKSRHKVFAIDDSKKHLVKMCNSVASHLLYE